MRGGRRVLRSRRDPLVRVITAVVCIITAGAGILAYLAAWVIIPEEGEKASIAENLVSKKQDA